MTNKFRNDKPFTLLLIAGVVITLVTILLLAFYFYHFHGALSSDQGVWGAFGDYLGGVLNPIVSLLAFFALLYTIKQQGIELRYSTEQLKKSAEALDVQNKYWNKQNFESTFFQLFNVYREIVDRTEIVKRNFYREALTQINDQFVSGPIGTVRGKEAMSMIARSLYNEITLAEKNFPWDGPNVSERKWHRRIIVGSAKKSFSENYGYIMSHYLNAVYYLFDFIKKSQLSPDDKNYYAGFIRSQLSDDELYIIFYDLMSADNDERDFSSIASDFSLFKYMKGELIHNQDDSDFYKSVVR